MINHSDVVPRVYEGGFKLWECALDLLRFLSEDSTLAIEGASVGELGCGHGLPAIHCLARGAARASLQDLNEDVLRTVTIPNLLRNQVATREDLAPGRGGGGRSRSVELFSGSWQDPRLAGLMGRCQYDLLLSSDTLYSLESIPHLLSLIEDLLAPGGVALVAAKRFYFGVGGSTVEFVSQVQKRPSLSASVVKVFEDGQSNIREIIRVVKARTRP